MGAFNIVTVTMPCPGCQTPVMVRVQFKYADTWQHEYKLGDLLKWGGNDVGQPGRSRVVVDGVAEKCPTCGYDEEWSFYVLIENDVIKAVESASGRYDFASVRETYLVLKE